MLPLTREDQNLIHQIKSEMTKITSYPWKVVLGRLRAPRFDIISKKMITAEEPGSADVTPHDSPAKIIVHTHAIRPAHEINPNWEADLTFISEAPEKIEKLLEIIDRLMKEKENGEQIKP